MHVFETIRHGKVVKIEFPCGCTWSQANNAAGHIFKPGRGCNQSHPRPDIPAWWLGR